MSHFNPEAEALQFKIRQEARMANQPLTGAQTLTGAKTESIASRLERAEKALIEVETLASEIHYELIGVHLPQDGNGGPEEPGTLSQASRIADRLEEVRRWLTNIRGFIAG
jgi:hypothetical protein